MSFEIMSKVFKVRDTSYYNVRHIPQFLQIQFVVFTKELNSIVFRNKDLGVNTC